MISRATGQKRPYYSSDQIEEICSHELRSVGLLPDEPAAIRIDRFLEKRFGITHEYETLPHEVLGYTRFGINGAEAVVVNRHLEESASVSAQRRARTTLAHEAGHIILHTELLRPSQDVQLKLFGEAKSTDSSTICRGDFEATLRAGAYTGDWKEYQANMVIGPILLPRKLVAQALENLLNASRLSGVAGLHHNRREQAVLQLSELFDVNPIVAKFRIDELYPNSAQLAI